MHVMLPHLVLHDLFDEEQVLALLDHVFRHEAAFEPTSIARGGVDPKRRISAKLPDPGPAVSLLRTRLLELLPEATAKLGIKPLVSPKIEIELVAHGDGAFFARHIDTLTAPGTMADPSVRVISGVYYFNAEPRRFSGGALRLYALGAAAWDKFVDVEPVRNSLVLFPSLAPHEVMPVALPSHQFRESRFAVNCWVHERRGLAAT